MSTKFVQILKFFSIVPLLLGFLWAKATLSAADFDVELGAGAGDWTDYIGTDTLAEALHTVTNGDQINFLDDVLDSVWANWLTGGVYTLLSAPGVTSTLTFNLDGHALGGVHLDIVTGTATFVFDGGSGGTLGTAARNFAIGVNGNSKVTMQDVTLHAATLQIGTTVTAELTLTGTSTVTATTAVNVTGTNSKLTLTGAALSTANLSVSGGGTLSSSGTITATGTVSVVGTGSTLAHTGTTLAANDLSVSGGGTFSSSGTVSIADTVDVTGSGSSLTHTGTTLNTKELSVNDNGAFSSSGAVTATDKVDVTGGTLTHTGATLGTKELLISEGGTLSSGGTITATDKVDVTGTGSKLTHTGSALNTAVLSVSDSGELTSGGTISATTVTVTGGNSKLTHTGTTLTATTSLSILDGGTLVSDGNIVTPTLKITGNGSKLTLNAGATLEMTSFDVSNGGTLVNNGTIRIHANELVVNGIGVTEVTPGSGTYTPLMPSSFTGSGTVIFDSTILQLLKVTNGAHVDLSNFGYTATVTNSTQKIIVDGIAAHAASGKSERSILTITGDLTASGGGTIDVTNGALLTGVANIAISGTGTTLTVKGAKFDPNSGGKHHSTLNAGGTLTIDGGGKVLVDAGGDINGITSVSVGVGSAGTLTISGMDATVNSRSTITSTGPMTIGNNAVGTVSITGGGVLKTGTTVIGQGAASNGTTVTVSGAGTGSNLSNLAITGNLTLADTGNADMVITGGGQVTVTGTGITTIGNTAGTTANLTVYGRGGTGSTDSRLNTAGNLIVGNDGNVTVKIGGTTKGGNVTSGGSTTLGLMAGSSVTVNIDSNDAEGASWNAGGTAQTIGTYVAPLGNSYLNVTGGVMSVSGLFAMAGNGIGTNGTAVFGGGSGTGELHMTNNGSFFNMSTDTFIDGTSKGTITIKNSGIVSGTGSIYAGEQFKVDSGLIAPGSRGMYDFSRTDPNNKLGSLGQLDIYDRDDTPTQFINGAMFRTELDRDGTLANQTGLSDRAVVHGVLQVDNTFRVDMSRPLDGKYLLITATDNITGFTLDNSGAGPRWLDLHTVSTGNLQLNLNGKKLKGNNRIDYDGGLFTTIEGSNKQIWLTVDTTSDGNVHTFWTGNDTTQQVVIGGKTFTTWSMTAENFQAKSGAYVTTSGISIPIPGNHTPFAGDNQFLDGDIVYFVYNTGLVPAAQRNVYVTEDNTNYAGDQLRGMYGGANVRVAEVNVIGNADGTPFIWDGGHIYAIDSALYTTLDKAGNTTNPVTPTGRFNKIGTGVLEIHNANQFYGGIHLGGIDPATGVLTEGGLIQLYNEQGFGYYNSASGFQEMGLVHVHEDSTIQLMNDNMTIQNRFIVDDGKVLTVMFPGDFTIAGNNALYSNADTKDGKGGGVFIGESGQIEYTGSGRLHVNRNSAKYGGGIYTERGYTLQVPAYIEGNRASVSGGGIYAEKFFALKDGSYIHGNTAQGPGGGIYIGNPGGLSTPDKDREFIIHGFSQIVGNVSGAENGGGVYVDAGRILKISTGAGSEGGVNFGGGDVWFDENYVQATFNPDTGAVVSKSVRNAIHLSNKATSESGADGALLEITGPFNTYFYDPITGDTKTNVKITGELSDLSNTLYYEYKDPPGEYQMAGNYILPRTQYGTVIFRDDSAFYGSTTVENYATFRLEDGKGGTDAAYGRRGTLSPTGPLPPPPNTFTLDATSWITGQGKIAANNINLSGNLDLDTATFTKPGKYNATTKVLEGMDGSGHLDPLTLGTMRGVLTLDGNTTINDSSKWYLTLGPSNTTDRVDVTGAAAFTGITPGEKMTFDVDGIIHGKYAVLTATGGITGYNTINDRKKSDAPVWHEISPGVEIDLAKDKVTLGDGVILGRIKATSYVEDDSEGLATLYLDFGVRNRHVTTSGTADWGNDPNWIFTAWFDITNSKITGTWSENDLGPATNSYIDGDMVTLHDAAAVTLTSNVNPVDLFVDGDGSDHVSIGEIGGSFSITTFSKTATIPIVVNGITIQGQDATTITPTPGDNDYSIPGYTGKLYKTKGNTLTFTNTGGNMFTGGIEIGTVSDNGGTIAFNDGNQLQVGTGAYIDFLGDGILDATASPTLASNIRVANTKTATFNVAAGTLTQTGSISNYSGNGAIKKTGAGTLTLTAQNTFTGGTTFEAGTSGTIIIGHNQALGTFASIGSKAGVVDVVGNGTIGVDAARTISNRFDVTGTLTVNNASALTIQNVNAGTSDDGGAIRNVGGTLGLTGGAALTLNNNQARNGGGIYDANTAPLTISKSLTFTNNKALAGDGGGFYRNGNTTFGGTVTFTNNTATGNGGGIFSTGTVTLSGANTAFSGNTAANGGAVYADGIALSGSATISNNTATSGNGGAFYVNGGLLSLTTTTAADAITFNGNNTAGNHNAVYLGTNLGIAANATIGGVGNTIFDGDTFVSDSSLGHTLTKTGNGKLIFTGADNTGGNLNSLINDFTGTTTISAGEFRIVGNTTAGSITYGNVAGPSYNLNTSATLTGGGTLSAATFTLSGTVRPDSVISADTPNVGDILTGDAQIGTLTFNGNVQFDKTTIVADLFKDTSNVCSADLLKVYGLVSVLGTNRLTDQVVFDFHNFTTGDYKLIESAGDITLGLGIFSQVNGIKLKTDGSGGYESDPDGAFTAQIHGVNPTARYTVDFVTRSAGVSDPHGNELWLTLSNNNLYMYWTGQGTTNNVWKTGDEKAGNWFDERINPLLRTGEKYFWNNDTVVFADSAPDGSLIPTASKTIIINAATGTAVLETVTAMIVDNTTTGGAYTFTGTGGIKTAPTYVGSILTNDRGYISGTNVPETLTKTGNGLLTFQNTGGNTFSGGIIFGGTGSAGTIAYNLANQLGDGGNGITFNETGALRPDVTGLTLGNEIIIADTKAATINVGVAEFTMSGLIRDKDALSQGELTKTGTGRLTLNNVGNTYTGTTTISGGTLRVVATTNTATPLGENGIGTTHKVEINTGATLELNVDTGIQSTLHQQIIPVVSTTTGTVTKSGAGEQILTHNNNTYSGGTTISASGGTLTGWYAASGGNAGSFGTGTITNNTALKYDMHAAGTATNLLAGAGTFTKTQTGGQNDLTLDRITNTFSGNITITGGTGVTPNYLIANDSRSLGSTAIGTATRTITLSGANDYLRINELTQNNTISNRILGSGGLEKTGSFTTTLGGNQTNTFTGGTDLQAGGLTLNKVTALGTYAGGTAGRVNVTTPLTTKTVTFGVASTTGSFTNYFYVKEGTLDVSSSTNATISGVNNSGVGNGGAFLVETGQTLRFINNTPNALTFTGNTSLIGANDVYLANAAMSITGTGNQFFSSGIAGTGTVTKSGSGVTQIQNVSNFDGTTTLSGGIFRVIGGASYGSNSATDTFNGNTGSTLAGSGTVKAHAITITGKISPDAVPTGSTDASTVANRSGTLTLSGTTVTLTNFSMDYDAGTPYTGGVFGGTTGDLLKITDATTVTLNSGTINFRTNGSNFANGRYLVVDSNEDITIGGSGILDGINNTTGVLKATIDGVALTGNSPRYGLTYKQEDFAQNPDPKQIWLTVERNTLTMNWQSSATTADWAVNSGTTWQSTQWTGTGTKVNLFNNGDYVNFTPGSGITQTVDITQTGGVVVSGMVYNGAGNTTFTGNGIASRLRTGATDTEITGKFLAPGTDLYNPTITPDGKLQKSGTGMLTFANGANTFNEGIEITGGTVGFSLANQLQVGSSKAITFNGVAANNAKLQANAAKTTLATDIVVTAGNKGIIDTLANSLTNTGKITANDEIELTGAAGGFLFQNTDITGTGTVTKTGAGTVQIGIDTTFAGTTTVSAGTFRTPNTVTYNSGTFTSAAGSTIAGGKVIGSAGEGIIKANAITIRGNISPDTGKVFDADDTAITSAIGVLTLESSNVILDGFIMQYDPGTPKSSKTTVADDYTGDLLRITTSNPVTLNGGTINVIGLLGNGYYLIAESNTAFNLPGGKVLDKINDTTNGVVNVTLNGISLTAALTPRAVYRVEFGQNADLLDNARIWLHTDINSLTMDWNKNGGTFQWNSADENWSSLQVNGVNHETKFRDGDYVRFNVTSATTINLASNVIVSGFTVGGSNTITFTSTGGTYGITSTTSDPSIIGRYLPLGDGAPTLTPDGKLQKSGSGTLAFQNTGGNRFYKGIEISAGTIAFSNGNQLNTLDTDNLTDNAITFKGNSALRSTANVTLGNDLKIDNGITATFNSDASTVFTVTGEIEELVSGTGNFAKDGTGTVRLTNTTNKWWGDTTVNAGKLQAVGVDTLGGNFAGRFITVNSGAILELEIASGNETLNERIRGSGSISKTGADTLILNRNDNDYSGETTVSAGTLTGWYAASGGNAGSFGTRTITNNAALVYDMHGTGTANNLLAGTGTFTKTQTGGRYDLTLTNTSNSFSGNITVIGGTGTALNYLIADDSRSLGAIGNTTRTITLTGAYDYLRINETAVNTNTIANKITGAGRLEKTGAFTTTISNANTFTGGTELNAGTLILSNAEALNKTNSTPGSHAGFVDVTGNSTVKAGGTVTAIQNRFEVQSGTLTIDSLDITGNDVNGVNGGAIELKSGTSFSTLTPLTMHNNKTNQSGGAIYAPDAAITIGGTGTNTIAGLTGNEAGVNGGGIYAKAVTVNGNQTISGNKATTGHGGALYLVGGTPVTPAISSLNANGGNITFTGNNDVENKNNAIYMDENVRLYLRGNRNIYLYDTIASKGTGKNNNIIDIFMDNVNDLNNVVYLNGTSDYYGDTDFRQGLVKLNGSTVHFGKAASDMNTFKQYANTVLFGNGTVEASTILLGGTLNAGEYTLMPRRTDIAMLEFIGETSIGELTGFGTTKMLIDVNMGAPGQRTDIISVVGKLNLVGTGENHQTVNDFSTSGHGKFLLIQTTDGVTGENRTGFTDDPTPRVIIDNFDTHVAGMKVNTYLFDVFYTLEESSRGYGSTDPISKLRDIYINVAIRDGRLIWNGLNYTLAGSSATHGNAYYNNKWVNTPTYNWQWRDPNYVGLAPNPIIEYRFWHNDNDDPSMHEAPVMFDAYTDSTANPSNYLNIRKNIEIITGMNDTYVVNTIYDPWDTDWTKCLTTPTGIGAPAVATVRNMAVIGLGAGQPGTYRFTGQGINAIYDTDWFNKYYDYQGGQLFITGDGAALFDNAANNFQRGIVLQNGAVGFTNVNQLGTYWASDPENGGKNTTNGIFVYGNNSYGILYVNNKDMELRTPIVIEQATSELIVNTNGDNFGFDVLDYNSVADTAHASKVEGNYTFTIANLPAGTDPMAGVTRGISGNGRLVKEGHGTLILKDANTYTGGTDINFGTVSVDADNRLGNGGRVKLGDDLVPHTAAEAVLRATATFDVLTRELWLDKNGGTLQVDTDKTLTWNGKVTDATAPFIGGGKLRTAGPGTVVLTNTSNDYTGDTIVASGLLRAVGISTLGDNSSTTTKSVEIQSAGVLDLNIKSGAETLYQKLLGTGEVRKTGGSNLTLATTGTSAFAGRFNFAEGNVYLNKADFRNSSSFIVRDGVTLYGTGRLGSRGSEGGIIASGAALIPNGVDASNKFVNPTADFLHINGDLTFKTGSLYQVVITQYPDSGYDPVKMRPVSDCIFVHDGGRVTIEPGANLNVIVDYWCDNISLFDFNENTSDRFTIIDASGGVVNGDPAAMKFSLLDSLPRGLELQHGWNGSLYQLWIKGDSTDLFEKIGNTHNQKETGTVVDYVTKHNDPGLRDLINILARRDLDDDTVRDILHQLSGDLRANSLGMALKMPWRHPFNRIDRDMFPRPLDPCCPITRRPEYKYKNEYWFEEYGQYTDVKYDGNSYSHSICRVGTALGVDKQICDYSLIGAMFDYSHPELYQKTGSVKMDDYGVGVYNMTKLSGTCDLKSYFGYSHQDYDIRRHVYVPAGDKFAALYESYRNHTGGDTFSMSFELQRPLDYNDYLIFTPLIALDYQSVWQRGYTETDALTALRYEDSQLECMMFRVGLNTKFYMTDKFDISGRLQYGTQLNKVEYPRSKTRFIRASDAAPSMDVWGSSVGRDYLNLGISGEYYLNQQRTTSVHCGYDADMWKRLSSHTGSIGFTHRW